MYASILQFSTSEQNGLRIRNQINLATCWTSFTLDTDAPRGGSHTWTLGDSSERLERGTPRTWQPEAKPSRLVYYHRGNPQLRARGGACEGWSQARSFQKPYHFRRCRPGPGPTSRKPGIAAGGAHVPVQLSTAVVTASWPLTISPFFREVRPSLASGPQGQRRGGAAAANARRWGCGGAIVTWLERSRSGRS